MVRVAHLNPNDNVITALEAILVNEEVVVDYKGTQLSVQAIDEIPKGHKMSLVNIPANQNVIKYGEIIGIATKDIKSGQHVHIHNVASKRGRGDLRQEEKI